MIIIGGIDLKAFSLPRNLLKLSFPALAVGSSFCRSGAGNLEGFLLPVFLLLVFLLGFLRLVFRFSAGFLSWLNIANGLNIPRFDWFWAFTVASTLKASPVANLTIFFRVVFQSCVCVNIMIVSYILVSLARKLGLERLIYGDFLFELKLVCVNARVLDYCKVKPTYTITYV